MQRDSDILAAEAPLETEDVFLRKVFPTSAAARIYHRPRRGASCRGTSRRPMGADVPGPLDWSDGAPPELPTLTDQPFAPLTQEFDVGELDLHDSGDEQEPAQPFCGLFAFQTEGVWCGDFFGGDSEGVREQ